MFFFYVSKQKLSQKVIIPKIGVGVISIVVSLLNAKKVSIQFLQVMKHSLELIYEKKSIFFVPANSVQI